MDNKRTGEGGYTLLYIIYRGRGNGKRKSENGKLADPLRRFAPRRPCLRGTKKMGSGEREEFL